MWKYIEYIAAWALNILLSHKDEHHACSSLWPLKGNQNAKDWRCVHCTLNYHLQPDIAFAHRPLQPCLKEDYIMN